MGRGILEDRAPSRHDGSAGFTRQNCSQPPGAGTTGPSSIAFDDGLPDGGPSSPGASPLSRSFCRAERAMAKAVAGARAISASMADTSRSKGHWVDATILIMITLVDSWN